MSASMVIWLALVAAPAGSDLERAKALEVYQVARDQTSHNADAQVRLALWCDAHGLKAEHFKHLALALITDPNHLVGRGLLGFVSYQGRWQRVDDVAKTVEADRTLAATLEAYRAKRATLGERADDHWALAIWCEQNGLVFESRAHLSTVTRLDPTRVAAWKRLGFRQSRGRWVSTRQYEAAIEERAARSRAERQWRVTLKKLRGQLEKPSRRDETEAIFGAVTDPYAVTPILELFGRGGPSDQRRAVQLLGQ
ncbi:polymorphic toxin-type HINT domain-containing protein, partial [Singulisphaera rosea]